MALAQVYEFKYPSQEKLCLRHRMATRIWKGITDENENYEVCECCGRKVGVQDVRTTCCFQSSQLSFLGVGLPLYFSYLRYSILLMLILTAIFCIFGLHTNITSKNCSIDKSCKENIFNILSILNKKNDGSYLSIQNYILLAFVLSCLLIFQFFRYRFRKIVEEIDQFVASPSDYSIILQRVPEDVIQKDIYDMIERRRGFLDMQEKMATDNLRVQKIIMSYDLTQFNKEKDSYLKRFKEMIKQGQTRDFSKPNLPKPTIPGKIAIVVFSKQQSKQIFIHEPKFFQRAIYYFFTPCSPLSDERINDQRISIQRAPQPDDIIWNNANVTVCSGICRKIILGTISFVLLMGGGFGQYGLALVQKDVTDDTLRILVGTLISVLVTITNLILEYFLMYTTYLEKMKTVTAYMDVLSFKLVFLQFLNSGLFIVIANIAANYETFNLQGSLSETITQIMLLNAITPNLSNFFMYKYDIGGRLMRYLCLQKKWSIYTQLQANQLSVLPQPFLPQKYSYIITTVWLAAFYSPFTPIVVPLSILGLTINYFVEKYLFGSFYSAPSMISKSLNESCIELFEYVPLILSIGEFLIYMYFKKFRFEELPIDWQLPIYFSIGISLFNLVIPMKLVNECICKMKIDLSNEPTYGEAEKEFEVTYQLTNPAYQSDRQRLWDVRIWKKMFGRVPDSNLRDMSQFARDTDTSHRKMMKDFFLQPSQNYYHSR